MTETSFDFGTNASATVKLPQEILFICAVLDFLFGHKKTAEEQILAACKDCGKVLKGYPNQTYSWLRKGIPNAIKTGDPDILALCSKYGIDVTKPLLQQNKPKIKAIIDKELAAIDKARKPAEEA